MLTGLCKITYNWYQDHQRAGLQEKSIDDPKYPDTDGLLPLGSGKCGLLVAFCAFVRYRTTQSLPIGDNWLSITKRNTIRSVLVRRIPVYGSGTVANPNRLRAATATARQRVLATLCCIRRRYLLNKARLSYVNSKHSDAQSIYRRIREHRTDTMPLTRTEARLLSSTSLLQFCTNVMTDLSCGRLPTKVSTI
jgi:hypothetical protein